MSTAAGSTGRRTGWLIALLAALVAVVVLPASAAAGKSGHVAAGPGVFDIYGDIHDVDGKVDPAKVPNFQDTNYPAQAAIGQTVRFTKCIPLLGNISNDTEIFGVFQIINYTGERDPIFVPADNDNVSLHHAESYIVDSDDDRVTYFDDEDTVSPEEICFRTELVAHKPGMMELKFHVNLDEELDSDDLYDDHGGAEGVIHHSFLGIWMQIHDVTLSADDSDAEDEDEGEEGDAGDNMAGKDGVPLIAKVRGSFPLGSKGKSGGKSTVILPDDFGWLAEQYAVDGCRSEVQGNCGFGVQFPGVGSAAYRWDVHDDIVVNEKTKGEAQHPFCQTDWPWTDDTGFNLYKAPHSGNKATGIRHPFWCDPGTEKNRFPKRLHWSTLLESMQTAPGGVDGGPSDLDVRAGIVKFLTNPFAGANAVPWPANKVDSVTAPFVTMPTHPCFGGPYNCYSTIFGLTTKRAPIGPFEQLHAFELADDDTFLFDTYIPDGKTDAGDAMMPAFRVDFRIQPNGSGKGQKKGVNAIDGAGELDEVEKSEHYSFDKNDDDVEPDDEGDAEVGQLEELVAPFYRRSIPALEADESGIGTTREEWNNNANGYLTDEESGDDLSEYELWDFAGEWTSDPQRGGNTNCAETLDDATGTGGAPGNTPNWREKPEDIDLAAVYVDEHGEGQVMLTPDDDFYFDNLGVKPNSQGGCDLQGIDVLGTSTVIATAYYPDQQPFGYKQVSSNSVKQSWVSGYNAQLSFAPKGANAPGHRVMVWYADITGNSREHDVDVCLSAPGGGVTVPTLFSSFNNEQFPQEDNRGVDGITEGPSLKCTEMQQQPGQKVLTGYFDVVGPLPLTVYALFDEIQIKRSITIAKKGASGGNPPPTAG